MTNLFISIQPWVADVLQTIKKELRIDHLSASPAFARAHFGNRPLNRIASEELIAAYEKVLLAGDTDLSDFVVNRWVFKHGDLYKHFAERLSEINPEWGSLEKLTPEESNKILEGASSAFGALNVYLFSVLNGVVFPEGVVAKLRSDAEKEEAARKASESKAEEQASLSQMVEKLQRDSAREKEKYESKVAGVMKKYATDIEALKKQIRSLQQQLRAK
jgi:hypothetical protein